MPTDPPPIVFQITPDFVQKLSPKMGDLLVVVAPIGFRAQECQEFAQAVQGVVQESGATVLVLAQGFSLERIIQEEMDWLAQEGLALRGYVPPGEDGARRFRVVHPQKGTLADHPSHLEAIRHARLVLRGGGPLPTPPVGS